MSSLAPSAAALAAKMAPPRVSPYDEVEVLLIAYKFDTRRHIRQNLPMVKAFFEFFGYGTTVIYADKPGSTAATRREGGYSPYSKDETLVGSFRKWFEAWADARDVTEDDILDANSGERKKLLIVCYFGHGSVMRTDIDNGIGGFVDHLYGTRSVILITSIKVVGESR